MPKERSAGQRFAETFRKYKQVFEASKGALEVAWQARGGGVLDYSLATMSAVGVMVNAIWPPTDLYSAMAHEGLTIRYTPLAEFVCKVLQSRGDGEELALQEKETALLWRHEDGTPLVGIMSGEGNPHLFMRLSDERGDVLLAELLEAVWRSGNELEVVRAVAGFSQALGITSMAPPGPYIGERGPDWYAQRLRRYPSGSPRTILFRGRSGVGKSVLARHIGKKMAGVDYRMLKIASAVLEAFRPDEVVDLIRLLRPTVLLLDDISFRTIGLWGSSGPMDRLLSMFEAVRSSSTLVFATQMTDDIVEDEPVRGTFYEHGMRPGRIDEVHHLPVPDAAARLNIMEHYAYVYGIREKIDAEEGLWDRLVEETDHLTGAYLANIMERLSVHGLVKWRDELNHVLWASPNPQSPEEEDNGLQVGASPERVSTTKAAQQWPRKPTRPSGE